MRKFYTERKFFSNCLIAAVFMLRKTKREWKLGVILPRRFFGGEYKSVPHAYLYNHKYYLDFCTVNPDDDRTVFWFYGSLRVRRHHEANPKRIRIAKA